jgi:hypothetical protein
VFGSDLVGGDGCGLAAGLQPHQQGTFKLSRDPRFAEKVLDVVGLYLDPPATHPRLPAARHHESVRRAQHRHR